MSLTKEDLGKIKKLVEVGTDYLDAKIDSLKSYILQRFAQVDKRLDAIEKKIDQLIKSEDEDIQMAYKEIQASKLRL